MSKKTIIIILVVALLAIAIGVFVGVKVFGNNSQPKETPRFILTLEDMYCNIKDSKKILKIKITIETTSEEAISKISAKQFLVRDEVNKIIRNRTEEDLAGREGQDNLQTAIKEVLVELFQDESIINVYFDDFIIQ